MLLVAHLNWRRLDRLPQCLSQVEIVVACMFLDAYVSKAVTVFHMVGGQIPVTHDRTIRSNPTDTHVGQIRQSTYSVIAFSGRATLLQAHTDSITCVWAAAERGHSNDMRE
jgi:hypothetical protein